MGLCGLLFSKTQMVVLNINPVESEQWWPHPWLFNWNFLINYLVERNRKHFCSSFAVSFTLTHSLCLSVSLSLKWTFLLGVRFKYLIVNLNRLRIERWMSCTMMPLYSSLLQQSYKLWVYRLRSVQRRVISKFKIYFSAFYYYNVQGKLAWHCFSFA